MTHKVVGDLLVNGQVITDDGTLITDVTFEDGSNSYDSEKLSFNEDGFYLSSDLDGNPVLNSITGASGEANTASNLAGDEGVYASKGGVDLRFKSLTAGANVSLSSDGNAITIESTASGGGGFYGIIWDDGVREYRTDRLHFNNEHFYLSGSEPVLNIHGLPDGVTLEAHTGAATEEVHDSYLDPGATGLLGRIREVIPVATLGLWNYEAGDVPASRGNYQFGHALATNKFSFDWMNVDEVTFNSNGIDVDFIWAGANDNDLVVIDAGTDKVGIGTAAPTAKLDVDGDIRSNDIISADAFYYNSGGSLGTDQIDFAVTTPAVDDNYVLSLHATYPYRVKNVWAKTSTGTIDVEFYISGTGIGGLVPCSITSAKTQYVASSPNQVVVADELTCYVSAESSPGDFVCTVELERNQ